MIEENVPFKSSNVELKEIINNSWDGICIIDKKTNFIYLNDAISPILGFEKDELISNPFLSFIQNDFKEPFLQLLKDNIQNSYNTDINLKCTRKDNKTIYLKITVSLMLNKKLFVLNAKDITKEISDEEILNNYVLSLHLDKNKIITKVSNAFCKLSGYSQNELINKNFFDLKHTEMQKDIFYEQLESLQSEKNSNEKFKLAKITEDYFLVDTKMKAIHNKYGDIIGYTLLMFDITTEEQLDQKLFIENSKLSIMSETIKTISHEWRQPLNIISLKAQNLQFEIEDESVLETLDQIQNKTKELSNTIEDFQNIIKIKSTKVKSNLDDIINRSISDFNKKTSNNIDFEIKNNFTKDIDIYEREIIKVLTSLFDNSYDAFTKNAIKNQKIKLETYSNHNTIHLSIEDNAGGIEEKILPNIYEPYFSTKEKRQGVGLGLYMTKIVIQMHLGGNIDIINKNDGVCVQIKIPFN